MELDRFHPCAAFLFHPPSLFFRRERERQRERETERERDRERERQREREEYPIPTAGPSCTYRTVRTKLPGSGIVERVPANLMMRK
jgi:hypothetical protein